MSPLARVGPYIIGHLLGVYMRTHNLGYDLVKRLAQPKRKALKKSEQMSQAQILLNESEFSASGYMPLSDAQDATEDMNEDAALKNDSQEAPERLSVRGLHLVVILLMMYVIYMPFLSYFRHSLYMPRVVDVFYQICCR